MKRSDLSTRYVLFVVDYAGVLAWDHLSAAVPPKVALAAIQREVDAGNLDYGVWLGRPFLTPQGRATLAELSRPHARRSPDRHAADPGYKNPTSVTHTFTFTCQTCGETVQVTDGDAEAHRCTQGVVISGNGCCGGNGCEASCEVCRRD